MNEIYLVSNDGHRESLLLNKYATTDEEIIKIALEDFKEYEWECIIDSAEIVLDKFDKQVKIKYYEHWDKEKQYLETKTYYTYRVKKYE